MKILFLARRFYPEIGGVEKHVERISELLIKKGHSIDIISEVPSEKSYLKYTNYHSKHQSDTNSINKKKPVKSIQTAFFTHKSTHVYYINPGKRDWFSKFRIWNEIFSLYPLFRDADIVHCHDVFFWVLPLRILFPLKKIYTTFHGYESYPIGIKKVMIHKLSEFLSNGNICVGKFIEKWYGTNAHYVIYGGVDRNIRHPKSNSKYKKGSALFYGRLDSQTGVVEYKKAVDSLKRVIPEFKLGIIGDGKDRKKVEKYVLSGFLKNPEQKLENYEFAFVSRYLSMLEAMMRKKLVFAFYGDPIKKDYLALTPFSKWIVKCASSGEIAEKVLYYNNHKKVEREMVNKAYEWASRQTWDKTVNTYLSLWGLKAA